ncbi:MAG: glycosyltransferase family 4 protein [Candidatus Binatia bacterium]
MERLHPLSERWPLQLCIVAHFAYSALSGRDSGHIGGVERQTSLMAHWFSQRGHRVSVITWDEGQPENENLGGVHIIKVCAQESGVPGVRFFYPRWSSLNQALARANADIYYQNCGEYVTGQVALWCQLKQRKFVYSVAAEADCDRRLPFMKTRRERVLYRFGVKQADRIVVQTRTQQRLLAEGFGRQSQIIPMPCLGPQETEWQQRNLPQPAAQRVLWVGRISEEKRPDRFLAMAERCPHLQFDLVGPTNNSAYAHEVLSRAQELPNVTVRGRATPQQLAVFYRQAACLCCTSDNEGFPNVFLEAWSHGLPVVSTVDPDNLIVAEGLGLIATDVLTLTEAVGRLLSSRDHWQAASANARRYYVAHHQLDVVMPQFERLFADLVQTTNGAQHRNMSTQQALC